MTLDETPNHTYSTNPLLTLNYEPALESIGDEYYDQVVAEEFPQHTLRWRNDALLPRLGLDPKSVKTRILLTLLVNLRYENPY
jgi:uncharacterized protein YdiU (UPF0061 family)